MSKVLLTGGTGYIGSHTAVQLIQAGVEVVIVDDLSNSSEDVVDRIQEITNVRPVFYPISCCDEDALAKVFEKEHVDGVIHFAGYKAVGESVEKPLKYYTNNLFSALNVLNLMVKYKVKTFIFSSSATVYGEKNKAPFTESMPTGGCTNPYGETKYMIEEMLKDISKAHPELSIVSLRYFNPVGAHESALLGEKPNGVPANLMPFITQTAAGIREELIIKGNDYDTKDGTGVRDYIHVVDLADAHVAAWKYCENHQGLEIVNIGTGNGNSVLELLNAFERVNGVKVPHKFGPRRPGDIATCYADCSYAKELLGWEAKKGIDEMVRDAWRWEQGLHK